MLNDITQDRYGWFYRDNGDDTADNLSADGRVRTADIDSPTVLIRDGQPTGNGDRLAVRVAIVLARRYTAA